jgi:hypothetical protein
MNKLYILTCFALVLLTSCKQEKKDSSRESKLLSLIIGDPVDYGFKNTLLFPVGANYYPEINAKSTAYDEAKTYIKMGFTSNSSRGSMADTYAETEYSNTNEEDQDIRNILFYNKINGNSFPLLSDTLHILSFAIHNEFKKPLIFYRMVKNDINGDGKYNSKDAVIFCISNNEGKNLVAVTPDNEQFVNYFYYKETNVILVKTAIDANKDKIFNSHDETTFREVKLDSPALGREIFTKTLIEKLKSQLK